MITEFPLFLFTTLGGAAAGGYVARAVFPLGRGRKQPWLFGLVCLVLLAIGGIALLFHLGRPERVIGAFANPHAGITLEGVTTVLFGISVLADCVWCLRKKDAPRWLAVLAAVLGAIMTVTMGYTYYEFIGTKAWSSPATIPFFVLGDVALGAGLYALLSVETLHQKGFSRYFAVVQVVAWSACCLWAVISGTSACPWFRLSLEPCYWGYRL